MTKNDWAPLVNNKLYKLKKLSIKYWEDIKTTNRTDSLNFPRKLEIKDRRIEKEYWLTKNDWAPLVNNKHWAKNLNIEKKYQEKYENREIRLIWIKLEM